MIKNKLFGLILIVLGSLLIINALYTIFVNINLNSFSYTSGAIIGSGLFGILGFLLFKKGWRFYHG